MNQTESGKSFEYAIASELHRVTNAPITYSTSLVVAKSAFESNPDNELIRTAASEVAVFLECHDKQLSEATAIFLQSDQSGKIGDVRDVIVALANGELGISAKNNHAAVKHSRLSDKIDFGKEWADYPVSSMYFTRIKPIFLHLRKLRHDGVLFRDILNKDATIYLPVLTAFEDELKRLCTDFRQRFISRMFIYLLGKHDFYKVIRHKCYVSIQSMNMKGTLGWGRKWQIPNQIDNIRRKPESNNTLLVSFVGGWQLSFRLHNASSRAEPSLKFDIQFVGLPQNVARHEIPLV